MNRCQFFNHMVIQQCESQGLPLTYQRVEYLVNSGNAYIDTNISPSNDLGIEICYMQTSRGSVAATVYGMVGSYNVGYFGEDISTAGKLIYSYGSGHNTNKNISLNVQYTDKLNFLNDRNFVCSQGTYSLDNVAITSATVYLFEYNHNGNNWGLQPFWGRIYYAKFSRGSNIINNFVPCYRKSDDKPGMYDLVSKTFFTNQGTGEFTVGPDV